MNLSSEPTARNEFLPIRRRNNKKGVAKTETALHDFQDEADNRIEVGRLVDMLGKLKDQTAAPPEQIEERPPPPRVHGLSPHPEDRHA